MAIWPKYSDGTDINALDTDPSRSYCATADDFGMVNYQPTYAYML